MDRLVSLPELALRFLFAAAPHAGGDDPGYVAFRTDSVTEVIAAIGTVSKHFTGIVGQSIGPCLAVIDVGRCDRHLLDQRGIGICSDVRLEAMNGALPLVLDPACIIIALTGRRYNRRIDQRTGLDGEWPLI